MKTLYTIFFCLLFSFIGNAQQGSFAWGVKGGLVVGLQQWNSFQRDPLFSYQGDIYIESYDGPDANALFAQAGYHIRGSAIRSRNNVLFTNCSSDFIVSEQLGFPYIEFLMPKSEVSPETDIFINKGNSRISDPIFKSRLYNPTIMISQPIFTVGIFKQREHYENKYVKSNSLDFENGIGDIFITEYDETVKLGNEETICSISDSPGKKKIHKFNAPTTQFQFEIFDYIKYNLMNLTAEKRLKHKIARKYIIENAKAQLKKYNY